MIDKTEQIIKASTEVFVEKGYILDRIRVEYGENSQHM